MPDIPLSSPQSNVETTSTPVFQDWLLQPDSISIDYYQGQAMPSAIDVNTIFKDVIGTGEFTYFSDFKYRAFVKDSGLPICVVMSGEFYTGNTEYHEYVNGLEGEMHFTFQNLHILPPGTYNYFTYLQISGNKFGISGRRILSEKIFTVKVRVYAASVPILSATSFDYVWTLGVTETLQKSLTITAPNWMLICPQSFTFSNVPFTTVTPLPDGTTQIVGIGTRTIYLIALSSIVPEDIIENPIHLTLDVNGNMMDLPITVTFVTSGGLFLSKDNLKYMAYKGITSAPAQVVAMNFAGNYKLSGPAWCIVSPSTGSLMKNISIGVMSADNMAEGEYFGVIEIRKVSDNSLLGTIDLQYNIIGKIKNPYLAGETCFTKDNNSLEFSSLEDNCYYDVVMRVTTYDFYTYLPKTFVIPLKVPLFQRKQNLNIGLTVDKLMNRMNDFVHVQGIQYRPADVDLEFTERSFDDIGVQNQYAINGLKFVAGLKPDSDSKLCILDMNQEASRVTSSSIYYINLFSPTNYSVTIYKNGENIDEGRTATRSETAGVKSLLVDLQSLDAKPGDIFEYRFSSFLSGTAIKILKVFPDGYNSNMIVWENEYKLKASMEFTGKTLKIKSDFDNRTALYTDNLVDVLSKIDSTKVNTLTISTGFILKSDIPSVESLCDSKRAILIVNGRVINLVPIQKSIITVNDDDDTISYDIEFQINRKYNEEIYSF
ncbi:hypothetical protein ACX0HA_09060 [Flavobacterium hauense]